MKKSSAKFKITLWYVVVMAIVSLVVFFVMYSVSIKSIEHNMFMKITRSVNMVSKRAISLDGNRHPLRPHEFFNDGVHIAIYSEDGELIDGNHPFGISEKLDFKENAVRSFVYNNHKFYQYDISVKNTTTNTKLWIKGVISSDPSIHAVRQMMKYNLIFIVIMIIIAAAGGYYITTRTQSPVSKIQATALSIIKSKDLKKRIKIGKGNDEFHALANTFDEMLDEIESVVEREKQFTSDASHELRTPVAVILSECEYMENYASTVDELKESAASVKKQTEKMSKLISELLSITRMDKNTLKLNYEETDISELVSFICYEQEQIHEDNIILKTNILPNIIARVDKILIARLFINLISNAYHYNVDGGEIDIRLKEEKENVIFSVSDTGIGISKEDIPKIWSRFYQVDKSRTSDDTGSVGLGLSMVQWIAEKHGGTIEVDSTLGEGSTFTFIFPKNT